MCPASPNDKADRQQPSLPDEQVYAEAYGLARLARAELKRQIEAALQKLGDPHLIRARVARSRIKTLASLRRKAAEHGWSIPEALANARDVIGFRIVCNNLQDARRAHELISRVLRDKGLTVRSAEYVLHPQRGGYRALHLWFPFDVQAGPAKMSLHCEVQIQSLLQDAWAQLSRVDIYRGGAPPGLSEAMERLSRRLYAADLIADGIRTRVARPLRGRKPSAGASLSAETIAFLYEHAFGSPPPDYLVRSTIEELADTPIRTDGLAAILDDGTFLDRLASSYREANRLDFDADPVLLFRWAVHAAVHGREAAIRAAKSSGRAEWRYTDRIYRSEALSSLPPDADGFVRAVRQAEDDGDSGSDIEMWAGALGGLNKCACGTTLVDDDAFADAMIKHYRLRGAKAERVRERIISAVMRSGVETGTGLCSYCSYVMSKDD